MAASKPTPTDLLWAYKLKTEHQHLLSRLLALESSKREQDARLDAVENDASSSHATEIAALTKQVKTLQDGCGSLKQMAAMERRLEERLEGVEGGSEAVCLKVEEIDRSVKERAKMLDKERAESEQSMCNRIGVLDTIVTKMDGQVQSMDRRVDAVESATEGLEETLRETTDSVARHARELIGMDGRLNAVEADSESVQRTIERIKAEQRELAALIEEQGRLQRLAIVSPLARPSDHLPTGPVQGNGIVNEPQSPRSESAKKSRKATERTRAAARELATLLDDQPVAAQRKRANPAASRKPAVRRGKGWIEVERTPSAQDDAIEATQQPVQEAVKRRPGRPARTSTKRKADALEEDLDAVTQVEAHGQIQLTQRQTRSQAAKRPNLLPPAVPTLRNTNAQKKPPAAKKPAATRKAPTGKRKGKAAPSITQASTQISQADTLILPPDAIPSSPPPPQPQQQTRTVSQNLFSSPLSLPPDPPSSPSPPQRQKTAAVLGSGGKRGRNRPKKADKSASRREIVQSDDWEEFERLCAEV